MFTQMSEHSKEDLDFSNLSNKEIDEFIDQLKAQKSSFIQKREEYKRIMIRIERRIHQKFDPEKEKRDLENNPEIFNTKQEMETIMKKRDCLEIDVKTLRELLFQLDESISMTKEDLTSKLLQRANFVAQREELDEIYEASKTSSGQDFELF